MTLIRSAEPSPLKSVPFVPVCTAMIRAAVPDDAIAELARMRRDERFILGDATNGRSAEEASVFCERRKVTSERAVRTADATAERADPAEFPLPSFPEACRFYNLRERDGAAFLIQSREQFLQWHFITLLGVS